MKQGLRLDNAGIPETTKAILRIERARLEPVRVEEKH